MRLLKPSVPLASPRRLGSANLTHSALHGRVLALSVSDPYQWVSPSAGIRGGERKINPLSSCPLHFTTPNLLFPLCPSECKLDGSTSCHLALAPISPPPGPAVVLRTAFAANVERDLPDGCHGIETGGETFILVAAPRQAVPRVGHWVAPVSYSCRALPFRKGLGRPGWPPSEGSQGPQPFVRLFPPFSGRQGRSGWFSACLPSLRGETSSHARLMEPRRQKGSVHWVHDESHSASGAKAIGFGMVVVNQPTPKNCLFSGSQ